MNLESTEPFAGTNWRVATIETPKVSTHAVFRPSKPPVAFGVNGSLDKELAAQLIQAIELSEIPKDSFTAAPLATTVNGFDTLVGIHGGDRRFVSGWWIDTPDLIHLVPVFSCELGPSNYFDYDRVRRYINVFELDRDPEPFFQLQMQGGASQLSVNDWTFGSYQELMSYVSVLRNENESTLMLKNRVGGVLTFPHVTDGWLDMESMILSHLQSCG